MQVFTQVAAYSGSHLKKSFDISWRIRDIHKWKGVEDGRKWTVNMNWGNENFIWITNREPKKANILYFLNIAKEKLSCQS